MLYLPPELKLILGIVAAFAGVLAGIIGNVLAINIVYVFTRRGRKPNPRPKLIWLMFYLSAFIFIVFSSVAAFAPSPDTSNVVLAPNTPEPLRPTSLEVKPSVIDIIDQNGDRMQQIKIQGNISKAELTDIDGDKIPEIIVGVAETQDYFAHPRDDCGKLIALKISGDRLWEVDLSTLPAYAINVGGWTGEVVINNFLIVDLFGDDKMEIVTLSHDLMFYPSKLTIILSDGSVSAEYWHPGFIYDVKSVVDHENDRMLLVARAVNNDLATQYNSNPSVVFALDPLEIGGQSPPYIFFEVERGAQLWYGMMVLPDHIQAIETRSMPTGVDQVVVQTDTGHFFYIDSIDGGVISVTAGGTGVQQNPPEYILIE